MTKMNICYTLLLGSFVAQTSLANDRENFRHNSGLVGPSYYSSAHKEGDQKATFETIQRQHQKTLKTDVTLSELDSVFRYPTESAGYAKDIFEVFKDTKGENPVLVKAQKKLPEGKVLAVHKFLGDKTEEGAPVQTVLNATMDKEVTQKYEAQTKVVAEKSGFKITFTQKINLLTGDKPTVSLKEEELKDGESVEIQQITDGIMNVAIYSDKSDIPTKRGTTKAIRQKFTLASERN